MNDLTRLKVYMDKCLGGGNPSNSKFKVVKRSYNNKKNIHEIDITYIYTDSNDPIVYPKKRPLEVRKRRIYDEIMKAKKVQQEKVRR